MKFKTPRIKIDGVMINSMCGINTPSKKESTEDFNKWAKYVADIERLETENAELTTHINELEKERVQLDDVISELSSKTEQLEKKLDIAIKALETIYLNFDDYDIDIDMTIEDIYFDTKNKIEEVK